jgi:hypothetical protein
MDPRMIGPGDEAMMKAISAFLAALFVVFAFGLFVEVAKEIRHASPQVAEAAEAAQPDRTPTGQSALSSTLGQGAQGAWLLSP